MICTAGRKCILSEITVGAIHESPAVAVRLAEAGQCVQQVIDELPERYPNLVVEKSVIKPNHVHLLVRIEEERAIRESPYDRKGSSRCWIKWSDISKGTAVNSFMRVSPNLKLGSAATSGITAAEAGIKTLPEA